MTHKLLITPRSFSIRADKIPNDFDAIFNSTGRILHKAEMVDLIGDAEAIIVGVDPPDRDVLD